MTRIRWDILVLIPIAVVLVVVSGLGRQAWYGRKGAIARDRDARTNTVVELAPVPLPTSIPLVGAAGRGHDGEPLRSVDRPAFRSLLFQGAHADLSRYIEQLQAEFEADPTCEYFPIDAADAFASAEPELRVKLDAWAKATPESFAPYLARAAYWQSVAQARRGTKWAADTPSENFTAMGEAIDLGQADVARALAIQPKLVAARRLQMLLSGMNRGSKAGLREALDKALAVCPTCFQVRVTYIFSLTPRWGGSHAAMNEFARASVDPARPRLRLLAGYADHDRSRILRAEGKLAEAREAIGRAIALGDHWEFLLERALIELEDRKVAPALDALDRAAALRPGHTDVLVERARALATATRWEDAGRDLITVLRTRPTEATARRVHPSIVAGLAGTAWEHHVAGRREDALRAIGLASALAPADVKVLQTKTAIEGGKLKRPEGGEIETLEQAIVAKPDSFEAHRALDDALARQRRFNRVVEMWTGYLGRHPNEGRAYLERGGAHYHLGARKEARADAAKACELGVSEGCEREKQMR